MSDETEFANADKALRDEIEQRAYFKYCERGCVDGLDVEDWLAAEQEVLAERAVLSAMSAAHDSGKLDPTTPNPEERRRQTRRQTTRRSGRGARPMR